MARNRNQYNYHRIFAAQPVEKKCQDSQALKPMFYQLSQCDNANLGYVIGTENAMANYAPAESLSQNVERYFSLLKLFMNGQNTVSNDVN